MYFVNKNKQFLLRTLFVILFILMDLNKSLTYASPQDISKRLSIDSVAMHTTKYNTEASTITEEITSEPTTVQGDANLQEASTPLPGIILSEDFNSSSVNDESTTEITITTTTALPNINEQYCVIPPNIDDLTQNQFSLILTNDCRYDKLTKPHSDGPLKVGLQIHVRHIEAIEHLQIKVHILVQYSYVDERLKYDTLSPNRGHMLGEDVLKNRIWVPHVILGSERDSSIMGLEGKDVFVLISPQGHVIYSYRMSGIIYCWMDLKKFPFDIQTCSLSFESWTYNASELLLYWDEPEPVVVASPLHLTEFSLEDFETEESLRPAKVRGAFQGNYSSVIFRFKIAREVGYYIMDYFLPSIMLVCTSWVTFWLQADHTAPRVTLGTSTMLSFITLASGQSKTLPKVSYIKVSEVWFLGCSLFIFASMVEFAFVNIIWRRRKKVELKKVNSKYILKSTLTPRLARRQLQQSNSVPSLYKTRSCTSLNITGRKKEETNGGAYNNYLTVHSFSNVPKITTQSDESLVHTKEDSSTSISMPEAETPPPSIAQKWTTMTPQEVAIWIDKRSRLAFPCAFLFFNILFWTIVFCL